MYAPFAKFSGAFLAPVKGFGDRTSMYALIFAYNAFWFLAGVLVVPVWLAAALVSARLRSELLARCSLLLRPLNGQEGGIWVHAASAGEVVTVLPLIRRLESAGHTCSLLTSSTLRGAEMAGKNGPTGYEWGVLPPDAYPLMSILFRKVRPKALVLVNSEFWMNLLFVASVSRVPVFVVNGKISDRSFRRFFLIRRWFLPFLLVPRLYLVRSVEDGGRFERLGVPSERVKVVGSLRFAAVVDRIREAEGRSAEFPELAGRDLFVAGSVRDGEEQAVLGAYRKLLKDFPKLRLILVPRDLARVPAVCSLAKDEGFKVLCRGHAGPDPSWAEEVMVWDRFGDLASLYRFARVAFVGGSLVDLGGHNPLESALWGVPTLYGPSRYNVMEECEFLEKRNLGFLVRNTDEMVETAGSILSNRNGLDGNRARADLDDARRQAMSLERTLEHLKPLLLLS